MKYIQVKGGLLMMMSCLGLNIDQRWTAQTQRLITAAIRRAAPERERRDPVVGLPVAIIKGMIHRIILSEGRLWDMELIEMRTMVTCVLQYYTLSR
jgi:hypothetical protein